jgi:tetratricopeptide (TPR) repeat protein
MAQSLKQTMYNYWKKTDITSRDGSKFVNSEYENSVFDINFISADSLYLNADGRVYKHAYQLKDSILVFNRMVLKVKHVSDTKLILDQADEGDDTRAIRIILIPKNLFDLTFTPESYKAKNGEIVYKQVAGKLEPGFLDKNRSPMDFIFERFGFPEYKKGGFVIRFIINTKGEIKGTKVLATSNDRYNDKLIDALNKTKGKWMPAEYMGKKVSTEVEYDFNLGYTERKVSAGEDSLAYSDMYYGYGNDFFERGSYKQAENYYKKAINYNPLNVNAYYQHAAASIFLRKKQEACEDYQQLIFLEQKKAKTLFDKYCKDFQKPADNK